MKYSSYFQSSVKKELCWLLSSTLKFNEHIAFDRSVDGRSDLFEYFVAPDYEDYFIEMMRELESIGAISNLKKMKNRFEK